MVLAVWDNIAGISSILLSKESNCLSTRLHGALNIKHFLECIRPFQDSDYGSVKYPSQVEERPYTMGSYEDAALKITYLPLSAPFTDEAMFPKIAIDSLNIAYLVELKTPPRRIDPVKLIAHRVPKGPLIGKLKNGEPVELPDGRMIRPDDVFSTEVAKEEKPRALIFECCGEAHIKAISEKLGLAAVWDNIAGILSSILLSKEYNCLSTRLHDALNIKHFLECIRPFQDSDHGSVKYPPQEAMFPKIAVDSLNTAYLVELKTPPKRIDPVKLIAHRVPKGPLIGKLINGEPVELPDGRMIRPDDVFSTEVAKEEKPRALIFECCGEAHIKAISENSVLQEFLKGTNHIDYVIHLSNGEIINLPMYKKFVASLGDLCKHIVVNETCPVVPGMESIFKNHRMLNEICPELFPRLHPQGWSGLVTQESELAIREGLYMKAAPLQRFWMRVGGSGEEPIIIDLRNIDIDFNDRTRDLIQTLKKGIKFVFFLFFISLESVRMSGSYSIFLSKFRFSTLDNRKKYAKEYQVHASIRVSRFWERRLLCLQKYRNFIWYAMDGWFKLLCHLRAVFVTHAHQDHMNGLYTIIDRRKHAMELSGKDYTPLVLVCNRNVLKPLKTYSMCFCDLESLIEVVDISRHPITPPASPGPPMKKRRLPSPVLSACRNVIEQMPRELFNEDSWNIQEIKAVQVHHTRMANGFIFGIGGKRVVFSGDTKPCDLLVQEGMNADLLIHEATFEDGHEDDALRKKHSTMGQAVEIGRKMKARHVILTHFSARYPKVPELPAYLEECGNVGVAVDNLRVRFDHLELVPKLLPIFKEVYQEELFEIELRKDSRALRQKEDLELKQNMEEVYQEELFEIELRKDSRALRQKEDLELKQNMELALEGKVQADVRILLIGEPGVGKTSLVMSLLEDEWVEYVPPKLDRVLIPADVTPENVTTSIVDCSVGNEGEAYISSELKQANVVCIVYSVSDDATIKQVTDRWLPLLREVYGTDHEIPVILVGNKSDGPSNHTEKVLPIMERWLEVETCVECSAKTMKNVSEIFFYAQKAVVHPTRPLYNADEKRLTDKARKALIRVFKICDRDNDGYLNDSELNEFQKLCFGIPLTSAAIEDVKRAVSDGCTDGIVEGALSLPGFLHLNVLFIERGRHETTWTVLRKFGYESNLKLGEEYLYPRIHVPIGCSTELTPEGIQFLSALFEKHDEDKDQCLSPCEIANLFSVCHTTAFNKELSFYFFKTSGILSAVETNNRGWITYTGYMSYWNMTTLINVSQAMEQLAYLGFAVGRSTQTRNGSAADAIKITRERKIDLTERGTTRRSVFMQSLVGRGLLDSVHSGRRHPYVINRVKVKEDSKYLLLREVDVLSPQDVLSSAETTADVVAFLYDISNPDSFSFCATIYQKYFCRTRTPCVIIATKVGREEVEQRWEVSPEEFCKQYELPRPIQFTDDQIGFAGGPIFEQLATMAVYPHLRRVYYLHDSNFLQRVTFGAALAALVGFLVFKNM
ncbi:GTP-binding domain protein [Dictyocaulus viviparus]|uniref:Mitochondrial Rho GTPase 1 n=1 Tax=Dictyocaulus viviparus TaxID=29172 RepID=A0A0D8Y7B8_DICVI|nr:GTP-binding domain protein [Dictyocaulus viviparus]